MDENLHDIEDLFFSELNDNDETPSEKVWEQVDKRLDKESVISIKKKYTTLKRIVIILLFLLSGFSIYTIKTNENNKRLEEKISKNDDKTIQSKSVFKLKEQLQSDDIDNFAKRKVQKKSIAINKKNKTEKAILPASESADNSKSQNIYNSENTNSTKIILKNKSLSTTSRKTKLTSEPFYQMKIKNAGVIYETTSVGRRREYLNIHKIIFLDVPNNLLIRSLIFSSLDSINTEEDLQLTALKKIEPSERNNNSPKSMHSKAEKSGPFSITPFFSPDADWYHLSNDNVNSQSTNATELGKKEKHEFSYTYGFLVDHKLNARWGIQSGLNVSNINIVAEPGILYAQPDNSGNIKYRVNTSSGYGFVLPSYSANPSIGDSLYSFTSTHSLQYIGIPLAVSYAFGKSKFIFTMRAGISTNFLTQAKLETTVEKGFDNSVETTNNIQGLKKLYFNGLVGLGVNYQLNKKTSIVFAPSLRFALNSINKNDPVKSYPMSFGSSVGLQIRL